MCVCGGGGCRGEGRGRRRGGGGWILAQTDQGEIEIFTSVESINTSADSAVPASPSLRVCIGTYTLIDVQIKKIKKSMFTFRDEKT